MKEDSVFQISPGSDFSKKMLVGTSAVLIDDRDDCWRDKDKFLALTLQLLKSGSRYFVCYGATAEAIHDEIDWIVIENNYHDVMTTYHSHDLMDDAAEFFMNVAMSECQHGIVFTDYSADWMRRLGSA